MRFLANVSIKRKLMILLLIASTAALVMATVAFVGYERMIFREAITQDLASKADVAGTFLAAPLRFDDPKAAAEVLAKLVGERKDGALVAAAVYTRQGQLFAQHVREGFPTNLVPAEVSGPEMVQFEGDSLALRRLVLLNDRGLGELYVRADLRRVKERIGSYGSIVVVVFLVSFGVAWLVSFRLHPVVSQPVLDLTRMTREVSSRKDYALRVPRTGTDELGELIGAFNEMLGQIQKRDAELELARAGLEQRVTERTRELHQQLTRISLLNQITHAISERQDLPSIFGVMLGQLELHLPVDYGAVYLFDGEIGRLSQVAQRRRGETGETDPALRTPAFSLEEAGLLGCLEGHELVAGNTVGHVSRLMQNLAERGILSAAVVPLMVEKRLFGVLVVGRQGTDAFSPGESDFLRSLSQHAALAGHQTRLHTELQEAYDELRRTQATVMQHERLRALGQMASGIAHDINNTLSPVSGYADLLLRTEPNLSLNARKYLQHIKMASDDAAQIVTRMRDFYRKREGTQPLLPVRLNDLAQQVVELTRPRWRDLAHQRGVSVDVQLQLDPGLPEIVGVESELREALTNLVFNAVDAMPNGGQIVLRSYVCGWSEARRQGRVAAHVAMEVADSGVGMDEETRKRCLEPFFSTKGQRGTGLGLAMVYGVLQRHDGTIEIESEPGRGTKFRLIFPVRAGTAEAAESVEPPPAVEPVAATGPLRILFVDDEPLLRGLVREILECDGHRVEVADGGQAGVSAFQAARGDGRPFDVVITDLGMPNLDGRQLAAAIKRESPATPVIMMTGWGTLMKGERDVPPHVDIMLNKPPNIAELQEALRKVVAMPSSDLTTAT